MADQLENIKVNGGLVTPQEVPGEINDWYTWATCINKESLEALIELSRLNIPAIVSSGPILGTSSPITIAETIAQARAQILACLVVSQLAMDSMQLDSDLFLITHIPMRTSAVSFGCLN